MVKKETAAQAATPRDEDELWTCVRILSAYLSSTFDLLLIDDVNDRVERSRRLQAQFWKDIDGTK